MMRLVYQISHARLTSRRGQASMEAIIPITLIFAMLFLAALIFSIYSNALTGQNAMTRTAAYVSATGAWSAQQRLDCLKQLPGYRPANGANQPSVDCQVYAQDNGGQWFRLPTNTCASDGANVRDCFNRPGSAATTQLAAYDKPLRIEISYHQTFPKICVMRSCSEEETREELKRSVQFYSQTRRLPNG